MRALPLAAVSSTLACTPIDWTVPDDAVFSDGCGGAEPTTIIRDESITVGDLERGHVLRIPGSYRNDFPFPLVFAFHGAGSNGSEFRDYVDLEEAARARAVFVYPDAREDADGFPRWDGIADGPDGAMFDAVVDAVSDELCIDQARIFLVGYSSGAGFSNALACDRSDEIRGVAPVAGGGPWTECGSPVAAVVTHGVDDPVVDFEAGVATRDHWVERNGCGETTAAVAPSPCVRYEGCDEPVMWCEHENPVQIAHGWPDFADEAIFEVFDEL